MDFPEGIALNAVGLSGPGARFLFETGRWQEREDSFMLSFMSVEKSAGDRLGELYEFIAMFTEYLPEFRGFPALQINFSCPNVGLHPEEVVGEIINALPVARTLGIPLVAKINLLVNPEIAAKIAEHPACDAICVSNTLPWGSLPERINWKQLFGTDESPLKKFGGGGLSGAPLFPLLVEWMEKAKRIISKPIIAGGGVLSAKDVNILSHTRPGAVSLGSIAMLRPWRLASAIRQAHESLPLS